MGSIGQAISLWWWTPSDASRSLPARQACREARLMAFDLLDGFAIYTKSWTMTLRGVE
jgi:hypothetical protein